MIGVIFQFGNEIVEVRIDGHNLTLRKSTLGSGFVPFDSLRLDRRGVEKEFPDLVDNPEWRAEAIKRFKDKIKSIGSEDRIANYVIEDLRKYGYIPRYKQKQGHRVEAII